MSNKKKILSLAIAVSMITSAFTSFAAPVNSKDSLFDVFDSRITMFDAENAGDSTVATTAPTATAEATEATTAPTATAEATEATTAPAATAEAAEATTAPTEAPTAAPTIDPSWDGSVDISENFDGESAVDGNGYKWDVVIGNDWGGTNKALSLTANDGKSILKVPNGMGSKTKDVKINYLTSNQYFNVYHYHQKYHHIQDRILVDDEDLQVPSHIYHIYTMEHLQV